MLTPSPNVMVLEVGPLRGHEGRALVNGISALVKGAPVPPLLYEDSGKIAINEPGNDLSPHMSIFYCIFTL